MYYYPWLSFTAGCALVSAAQVLCYLSIAVVSALASLSTVHSVKYEHMQTILVCGTHFQ